MILKGKKGLIKVAKQPILFAGGIAKACREQGAELAFTFLNSALEKRVRPIAQELAKIAYELDEQTRRHFCALVESLKKRLKSRFCGAFCGICAKRCA